MLKICLVFRKSEPQYAYKRYAYKKKTCIGGSDLGISEWKFKNLGISEEKFKNLGISEERIKNFGISSK